VQYSLWIPYVAAVSELGDGSRNSADDVEWWFQAAGSLVGGAPLELGRVLQNKAEAEARLIN
jgi:hypothetical protein